MQFHAIGSAKRVGCYASACGCNSRCRSSFRRDEQCRHFRIHQRRLSETQEGLRLVFLVCSRIFQPIKINGIEYVDGFLSAKNPSLLALNAEKTLNENLILISLGTGILREVDSIEYQVRATHKTCEDLASKHGFHYFRFNPTLIESADDMQDTRLKNIFALKKDSENYLFEKKEKFDGLLSLLNKIQ